MERLREHEIVVYSTDIYQWYGVGVFPVEGKWLPINENRGFRIYDVDEHYVVMYPSSPNSININFLTPTSVEQELDRAYEVLRNKIREHIIGLYRYYGRSLDVKIVDVRDVTDKDFLKDWTSPSW